MEENLREIREKIAELLAEVQYLNRFIGGGVHEGVQKHGLVHRVEKLEEGQASAQMELIHAKAKLEETAHAQSKLNEQIGEYKIQGKLLWKIAGFLVVGIGGVAPIAWTFAKWLLNRP